MIEQAHQAVDDVVDVGEVAAEIPVVEHLDGPPFDNRLHEEDGRHVGPAPRSVDGEEAQPGGGEAVEAAVGVGHQLVGLLGGGIEADGAVGAVVFAIGHAAALAVDAARTGVEQMPDAVVAAVLEHVEEAHHVRLHIGIRVLDGIAHAGLPRHVDHHVEAPGGEEGVHADAVGDVEQDERIAGADSAGRRPALADVLLRHAREREARILEPSVVVGVDVVDADHRVPGLQKPPDEGGADESGCSSYQYFHFSDSLTDSLCDRRLP